jgi:hypothetical protein
MDRAAGVFIGLVVLGFFSYLLFWAGLGFDHQVVQNWVTTVNTPTRTVTVLKGQHHHGTEGIAALSVFLGLVWALIATGIGFWVSWAWRGYPG